MLKNLSKKRKKIYYQNSKRFVLFAMAFDWSQKKSLIFVFFFILIFQNAKNFEFDYMTGSGLSTASNSGIRTQRRTKNQPRTWLRNKETQGKREKKGSFFLFFSHIHRLKCVCSQPTRKVHIKCGAKKKALNLFQAKHTKRSKNNSTIIIMIRLGFCSISMCDNIRRIEGVSCDAVATQNISVQRCSVRLIWFAHTSWAHTTHKIRQAAPSTSSMHMYTYMYVLTASSICTARFSCY